jgi:Domain of Unknown Function (DUF928)
MKKTMHQSTIPFIIVLFFVQLTFFPAEAQIRNNPFINIPKLIYSYFNGSRSAQRTSTVGKRRTKAAFVRGSEECDLVALIPNKNLGITAIEKPDFWFYFSKMAQVQSSETPTIDFSVVDNNGKKVWQFKTDGALQGLVRIHYQGEKMKINNRYSWRLDYSNKACSPETLVVYGEVVRESFPELGKSLNLADTPRHRLHKYIQQGIWYELVDELISMRQNSSNAISDDDFISLFSGSKDVFYSDPSNPKQSDLKLVKSMIYSQIRHLN